MLRLEAVSERTALLDPAGHRAEQVIEHRTDPLTGAVASVNLALGEKARAFLGTTDAAGLRELQERSREGCPFCSAAERGTRFLPDLVPEGQLRVGRALAIPNLFSKSAFDSVVILDQGLHELFPSRLPADSLADAIRAAAELVRRARARDPALVHHVAGMNFLQPGGSSVPHPHFQVHARGVPYSGLARLLRLSDEFRQREGRSYWDVLVEQETGGPRRVGRTGSVEWLVPWAPAHQKEVWGLLPGTGSLAELGGGDASGFAAGISKVVSSYEEGGTCSFTLAFLSCPEPGRAGAFPLQVRICSRPALRPLYPNHDTWFTPLFMGDDVHIEAPEAWAARLRARF
jgi:galactose-1-phosphate uridylyltransferase